MEEFDLWVLGSRESGVGSRKSGVGSQESGVGSRGKKLESIL
ncbi:hypothetical protein [Moorena bouillonii]|nr:hypothetical protein [Moorena bouillonii]